MKVGYGLHAFVHRLPHIGCHSSSVVIGSINPMLFHPRENPLLQYIKFHGLYTSTLTAHLIIYCKYALLLNLFTIL